MSTANPIPFMNDSHIGSRIDPNRGSEALQPKEGSRAAKGPRQNQFNEAYREARESRSRQEKDRLNALSDKNNEDQKGEWVSQGREGVSPTSPVNASSNENATSATSTDDAAENPASLTAMSHLSLKISGLKGDAEQGEGATPAKGTNESRLQVALAESMALEEDLARIGSLGEEGEGFSDIFKGGVDKGLSMHRSTLSGDSPTGLQSEAEGLTSSGLEWRTQRQIVEHSIVDQIAQKLLLRRFDRSGPEGVTIELTPKELGTIKIDISIHKGIVSADILTKHIAVKEILEKNQALLHDALIGSGLNIDHFSVNVGNFGNNNYYHGDNNDHGITFAYEEESRYFARPALAMVGEILKDRYYGEGGISVYI